MSQKMKSTTTKSKANLSGRRRKLIFVLVGLLILVVVSSVVSVFYFFPQRGPAASTANQVVGHAFFRSSGQLNEGNSQGINDELQIELRNIAAPVSGKSYYAWLLGDTHKNLKENFCRPQEELIFLGSLSVNQGTVNFSYAGDSSHTNLISCTSRLLITEESAASRPQQPSTDKHTWMFYTEIPQLPDPQDSVNHFSALDDIRHLLYEGPDLKNKGLHGGLDIQLLRNAQKVLEWAGSARDAWNGKNTQDSKFIHRQVVRILDYLDGTYTPKKISVPLVQTDVPPGTPLLVDPVFALVPMLDLPGYNTAYLARISRQLQGITTAPGVASEMRVRAAQIRGELLGVKKWLANMYKDAKELVALTDSQLMQPSTLIILNDLENQANAILVGQLDSSSGQVTPGVVQIHYNILQLVTFDIRPFTSQS